MKISIAAVCLVIVATATSCFCQLSKLTQAVGDCGTDLQLSSDITTKISETIDKHLSGMKQGKVNSVLILLSVTFKFT